MASTPIDDGTVGNVLPIVNENRPNIDKDKEEDVREFLQREQEWENVVWYALRETIHGMESMARVRRRNDPLVMGLMERFVDQFVVKASMDEVDAKIGEEEEQWNLRPVVPNTGALGCRIIQLAVAQHFRQEKWRCKDGHYGERDGCLGYFHADLILEEFGMFHAVFVEDENIGEGGENEVHDKSENPVTNN